MMAGKVEILSAQAEEEATHVPIEKYHQRIVVHKLTVEAKKRSQEMSMLTR